MSFKCHFAISAGVRFGWNSVVDGFNLFSSHSGLLLYYLHVVILMDIAVEMVDQLASSKYALLRNSNGAIFANT